MEFEVVGQSNKGRNLYLAKIGNPGNPPVMIISQQHGNEMINSESRLQLIQWLYKKPRGGAHPQRALRAADGACEPRRHRELRAVR